MYLEGDGLRIGADVAVASYDDTPVAVALNLTSVQQNIDVTARAVPELLIGKIRGIPAANAHVLVEPRLVIRASSGGGSGPTVRP